jgi:hypothetical protein
MDFAKLQSLGAIVPKNVFERKITVTYKPQKPEAEWTEAHNPEFLDEEVTETWPVFIRLPSAADAIEIATASDRDRPFVGIFRCWVNEDGTEFLPSLEMATSIRPWLALPLWDAINSLSPTRSKKSKPSKKDGASSPSSSAAAQ